MGMLWQLQGLEAVPVVTMQYLNCNHSSIYLNATLCVANGYSMMQQELRACHLILRRETLVLTHGACLGSMERQSNVRGGFRN